MDLQTILIRFISFFNEIVIPLLFVVALLMFLWNATRYFIIGGSNEDDQEKARRLAVWGILAFVIIVAFWGIINLLIKTFDVGRDNPVIPDYMCEELGVNCNNDTINTSGFEPSFEDASLFLPEEVN